MLPRYTKLQIKMLVEIWLMFVIVSISLFIAGVFYNKFFGKVLVLALSSIFMIPAVFYSFNLEKVGFGSEAVITGTYAYHPIGFFFAGLWLLNIGLLIFFSVYEGIQESGVIKHV